MKNKSAQFKFRHLEPVLKWLLPIFVMLLSVVLWDRICVWNNIPSYILPRPGIVLDALLQQHKILFPALAITLEITFSALAIAIIGGVGLAVLLAQSKWIEMAFLPYAVILQVTPIIVIAPLIFIYVESKYTGLLMCAWVVAFFPILSNTTLGLNSVDHHLLAMMKLYGANRWQTLWYLRLPAALPFFLGGLKVAAGLALIGAIVAEFVAGTGGIGSGLAFVILEASYRLDMPLMYAAIVLISATGSILYLCTSLLSYLLLNKWHESEINPEN